MEIMVAMCIDKEFSRGGARHKYYGIRVLDSVSKIGRILIICIRSRICSEKEIVIVEKKLLSFFSSSFTWIVSSSVRQRHMII